MSTVRIQLAAIYTVNCIENENNENEKTPGMDHIEIVKIPRGSFKNAKDPALKNEVWDIVSF